MTTPPTLYWSVLKRNFDVERGDVILGHNVEYTGSMSRLPILVLECSKGRQLEGGGMPNRRREIWPLQGVKVDEMDWNFHRRILTPWATISTRIHSPGPLALWANMQKPFVRVERLLGSVKQQNESDGVTLWQVNKTHWRPSGNLDVNCQDLDCLLTLLVSLIRCAKPWSSNCYLSLLPMKAIQTAFCCSCWWRPPGL